MVQPIDLVRTAWLWLDVSESIESEGSGLHEITRRANATRVYYACFHVALEYIRQHSSYVPNRPGHDFVRNWFYGKPGIGKLERKLGRMHETRCKADYDLGIEFDTTPSTMRSELKGIIGAINQEMLDEVMKEFEARKAQPPLSMD